MMSKMTCKERVNLGKLYSGDRGDEGTRRNEQYLKKKKRHLRMMDRGYIVSQDDWYLTQRHWNSLCVRFSKAKVLVNDCPCTV